MSSSEQRGAAMQVTSSDKNAPCSSINQLILSINDQPQLVPPLTTYSRVSTSGAGEDRSIIAVDENILCYIVQSTSIRIIRMQDGTKKLCKGNASPIGDIKLSPIPFKNSALLASVDSASSIVIWQIQKSLLIKKLLHIYGDKEDKSCVCSTWHPSKPGVLATADEDGYIYIWDLNDLVDEAKSHDEVGLTKHFSESVETSLYTLYRKPLIPGKYSFFSVLFGKPIKDMSFLQHESKQYLVTCTCSGAVVVWDVQSGSSLHRFYPHGLKRRVSMVRMLRQAPNRCLFFTATSDSFEIKVWSLRNPESWTESMHVALASTDCMDAFSASGFKICYEKSSSILVISHPKVQTIWVLHLDEAGMADGRAVYKNTYSVVDAHAQSAEVGQEQGVNLFCAMETQISSLFFSHAGLRPLNGVAILDRPCLTPDAMKQPGATDLSSELRAAPAASRVTPTHLISPSDFLNRESRESLPPIGDQSAKASRSLHASPIASFPGFDRNFVGSSNDTMLLQQIKALLYEQKVQILSEQQEWIKKEGKRQTERSVQTLRFVQILITSLKNEFDSAIQSLNAKLDSILQSNVNALSQAIPELTEKLVSGVQRPVGQAFKNYFSQQLIPAFEDACKSMLSQISEMFENGVREYAVALSNANITLSPPAAALDPAISSLVKVTERMSKSIIDTQERMSSAFSNVLSALHPAHPQYLYPIPPIPAQFGKNPASTSQGAKNSLDSPHQTHPSPQPLPLSANKQAGANTPTPSHGAGSSNWKPKLPASHGPAEKAQPSPSAEAQSRQQPPSQCEQRKEAVNSSEAANLSDQSPSEPHSRHEKKGNALPHANAAALQCGPSDVIRTDAAPATGIQIFQTVQNAFENTAICSPQTSNTTILTEHIFSPNSPLPQLPSVNRPPSDDAKSDKSTEAPPSIASAKPNKASTRAAQKHNKAAPPSAAQQLAVTKVYKGGLAESAESSTPEPKPASREAIALDSIGKHVLEKVSSDNPKLRELSREPARELSKEPSRELLSRELARELSREPSRELSSTLPSFNNSEKPKPDAPRERGLEENPQLDNIFKLQQLAALNLDLPLIKPLPDLHVGTNLVVNSLFQTPSRPPSATATPVGADHAPEPDNDLGNDEMIRDIIERLPDPDPPAFATFAGQPNPINFTLNEPDSAPPLPDPSLKHL